ncbi:hypothetical protein CONPUDRAFT_87244 [Coniophora puteana RWD-64-598 SS2]|uniref:F-box domain-containing protein n=1 Tax=Coniophora puteana (strain RWD-64-598) TaxID=741705 RepID=A0A5M3N037_CONPW|nr:uncharacterized protein CONPUDRAFT_87244 [Coniophora puteana RWD-64-598 SS2]EIW84646.1 hypothetical protein CONPUDRAFT_87244 [Coniophora puteana RWD-64-598 SS2]
MDHSILIPELLHIIFGYLSPASDSPTLASLARTCRLFNDAAMDVLYTEVVGAARLLMLLPMDAWELQLLYDEEEELDVSKAYLTLTRTLTMDDWRVFERKTQRIKKFTQPESCPIGIDVGVSEAACLSPHAPLLPNLQVINWDREHLDGLFFRHLIGPSLVTVKLLDIPQRFFPLIPILGRSCPSLRHLSVVDAYTDALPDFISALGSSLPHMAALETLLCGELTYQALTALASLPNLKRLCFSPPLDPPPMSSALAELSHGWFPALQELSLAVQTLSDYQSVLRWLGHMPRLRTFRTKVKSSEYATRDVGELVKSLSLRAHQDELREVLIFNPHEDTELEEGVAIPLTISSLRPLLRFSNLERVVIYTSIPFSLTDSDIETMSLSWPKLRFLSIVGWNGWYDNAKISLWGLAILLRNCPYLDTLDIVLDATIYCQMPLSDTEPPRNTRIAHLTVDDSPIDDPVYVASYLANILPRLRSVSAWRLCDPDDRDDFDDYAANWEDVSKTLQGLALKHAYENYWKNSKGSSKDGRQIELDDIDTREFSTPRFWDDYMTCEGL